MPPSFETEGEFKGWKTWKGEAFENIAAGPFYWTEDEQGSKCAFRVAQKHLNGGGRLHGGCMMTFGDFALFAFAQEALDGGGGVTVTFNSEFLGGPVIGDLVEMRGEVLRSGGSMIFVRGTASVESKLVFSFSGTIKRMRRS